MRENADFYSGNKGTGTSTGTALYLDRVHKNKYSLEIPCGEIFKQVYIVSG